MGEIGHLFQNAESLEPMLLPVLLMLHAKNGIWHHTRDARDRSDLIEHGQRSSRFLKVLFLWNMKQHR